MGLADDIHRYKLLGEQLKLREEARVSAGSSSHIDEALRQRDLDAGYVRNDDSSREVVEHTLLFLRSLFSGSPGIPKWVADGSGRSHIESDIIIENMYAKRDFVSDPSKPHIYVQSGPSGGGGITGGNTLRSYDFSTDTSVYTDMESGTIGITIQHQLPEVSREIGEFIKKSLNAFRREFCYRRVHDIRDIQMSGYDPNYRTMNQNTQEPTYVPVQVQFTYFRQWTMKVSTRPGVYGRNGAFMMSLQEKESPNPDYPNDLVEGPETFTHSITLEDLGEE